MKRDLKALKVSKELLKWSWNQVIFLHNISQGKEDLMLGSLISVGLSNIENFFIDDSNAQSMQ